MEVAIVQIGQSWETVAATALVQGIRRVFGECNLHWVTSPDCQCLLQYNPRVASVSTLLQSLKGPYDFVVNLTPDIGVVRFLDSIKTNARFGFVYDKASESVGFADRNALEMHSALHQNQSVDRSILQLLFRTVGMTWKGEGYDLAYYPRNRAKKGKTGIAISNENLRRFVKSNLRLDLTQLWHIPMRQNLLKRIDEINRCKSIVTDDLFVVHAAIAMRKSVQFLDTQHYRFQIEFFGRGQHHRIDGYEAG